MRGLFNRRSISDGTGAEGTPQGETIALTGNGTFGPYSVNMVVKITSNGDYNLAASGSSVDWIEVTFMNTSAYTITLTDPSPSQTLFAGMLAKLIYDGSTWR